LYGLKIKYECMMNVCAFRFKEYNDEREKISNEKQRR
jgi:hypothetical protein